MAQALLDGTDPPDNYNAALFCPIPKTASHEESIGNLFHLPKDTRPISVVNADNRIVANLFRVPFALAAARLVHPCQRGFLMDRVLTDNVIDLDLYMRHCYAEHTGLLGLADIEAAFPTLSHHSFRDTLSKMGLPSNWRKVFKSFLSER